MTDYFSSYSSGKFYRGGNGFDYFSASLDYPSDNYKRNDNSFINNRGELEHRYPYDDLKNY